MKPKVTIQGVAGLLPRCSGKEPTSHRQRSTQCLATHSRQCSRHSTPMHPLSAYSRLKTPLPAPCSRTNGTAAQKQSDDRRRTQDENLHVLAAIARPADRLADRSQLPSDGIDAVRTVSAPASESAHCGRNSTQPEAPRT